MIIENIDFDTTIYSYKYHNKKENDDCLVIYYFLGSCKCCGYPFGVRIINYDMDTLLNRKIYIKYGCFDELQQNPECRLNELYGKDKKKYEKMKKKECLLKKIKNYEQIVEKQKKFVQKLIEYLLINEYQIVFDTNYGTYVESLLYHEIIMKYSNTYQDQNPLFVKPANYKKRLKLPKMGENTQYQNFKYNINIVAKNKEDEYYTIPFVKEKMEELKKCEIDTYRIRLLKV